MGHLVLLFLLLLCAAPVSAASCVAGRWSNLGAACEDCPAGKYQDQSAATDCTACIAGRFGAAPARTSACEACPAGSSSVESATACFAQPVLTVGGASVSYTEGAAPVPLVTSAADLSIADSDSSTLLGATVMITGSYEADDVLSLVHVNGNITPLQSYVGGVLTLSSMGTLAEYEAVLRTVHYHSTSKNPGTAPRSIVFTVRDSTNIASATQVPTATRTLAIVPVNDVPTFCYAPDAEREVTFTEDQTVELFVQPSGVVVADVDNTRLKSARMKIYEGFQRGQDELWFTDTADIEGSWSQSSSAGTLTLTAKTTAPIADFVTGLQSVTYVNSEVAPNTADRKVLITVNDGEASSVSNCGDTTIHVVSINNLPTIAVSGTFPTFTENDAPVQVVSTVTITDPDTTTLQNATVAFGIPFDVGKDTLAIPDPGAGDSGLTTVWDAQNGALVLNGAASLAAYQAALARTVYSSTSEDPAAGKRRIGFSVHDGMHSSAVNENAKVTVVAVNDRPVLLGGSAGYNAAPLSYAEDADPVYVLPTLQLVDMDNEYLSRATVFISQGLSAGDTLSMQFSAEHYSSIGLDVTWTASTGHLRLLPLGSVSKQVFAAALRQVRFHCNSTSPSTVAREISFVVVDGALTSETVVRDVAVASTNDKPELTGTPRALSVHNMGRSILLAPAVTVLDVDHSELTKASITITPYVAGMDMIEVGGVGQQMQKDVISTGLNVIEIGVLEIASGPYSLVAMEALLRTVSYYHVDCDFAGTAEVDANELRLSRKITLNVFDGVDWAAPQEIELEVERSQFSAAIEIRGGTIDQTFFQQKLQQGTNMSINLDLTPKVGALPEHQSLAFFLYDGSELQLNTSNFDGGRLTAWMSYRAESNNGTSPVSHSTAYTISTELTISQNFFVRAFPRDRPQCEIASSKQIAIECKDHRKGSRCRGCETGWYQDPNMANNCLPCGAFETTTDDAPGKTSSSCYCTNGFFKENGWDPMSGQRKSLVQLANLTCIPCPTGAQCMGLTPKCLGYEKPCHAPPAADNGYWASRFLPNLVMECKPKAACPGYETTEDGTLRSNRCNEGYEGQACSLCAESYYRISGKCSACPDNGWILLLVYTLGFVALSIGIQIGYRKHGQLFSLMMPSITITSNYFQVLANFAHFEFWPSPLGDLFDWLSVANLNLDIVSPECVGVGYETKWLLVQGLPVLSVIALVGAVAFHYLHTLTLKCLQKEWREAPKEAWASVQAWTREGKLSVKVASTLVLLDAIYLNVCGKLFELFDCKEQFPGHFVLEAEPRFYCATFWPGDPDPDKSRDATHGALLPWGFFFLFANVIGIPCLFARVLFWGKKDKKSGKWKFTTQLTQQRFIDYRRYSVMEFKDPVQMTYGCIYERFTPERWWWILILLTKEVSLVMCGVMFTSYVNFKLAVMCMVLFVAYTAQLVYKPYINVMDTAAAHHLSDYNRMEARLLGICIFILLSGFVFRAAESEVRSKHTGNFIAFLTVIMTILICTSKIYVIAIITRELTRALKLHNYRRKSLALGLKESQMRNPLQLEGGITGKDGGKGGTVAVRKLQAENAALKKQLADLKKGAVPGVKSGGTSEATTADTDTKNAIELQAAQEGVGARKAARAAKNKDGGNSGAADGKALTEKPAAPLLPTKMFEVFTLDDPTNGFPEEVEFRIDRAGIEIVKQGSKAAVETWLWEQISKAEAEVTKDEEYPDEMDIFRVTITGDELENCGQFAFECDDANAVLAICNEYKAAATADSQAGSKADAEKLLPTAEGAAAKAATAAGGKSAAAATAGEGAIEEFVDAEVEAADVVGPATAAATPKAPRAKKKATAVTDTPALTADACLSKELEQAREEVAGGTQRRARRVVQRRKSRAAKAMSEHSSGDGSLLRIPAADLDAEDVANAGDRGTLQMQTFACFTFDVPPAYPKELPDDVRLEVSAAGVDVVNADNNDIVETWKWKDVLKYEAKRSGAALLVQRTEEMETFVIAIKGWGRFLFETRAGAALVEACGTAKQAADKAAAQQAATNLQAAAPADIGGTRATSLPRKAGRRKTEVVGHDVLPQQRQKPRKAQPSGGKNWIDEPEPRSGGQPKADGWGNPFSGRAAQHSDPPSNADDAFARRGTDGERVHGEGAGFFRVSGGKAAPAKPTPAKAGGWATLSRTVRKKGSLKNLMQSAPPCDDGAGATFQNPIQTGGKHWIDGDEPMQKTRHHSSPVTRKPVRDAPSTAQAARRSSMMMDVSSPAPKETRAALRRGSGLDPSDRML